MKKAWENLPPSFGRGVTRPLAQGEISFLLPLGITCLPCPSEQVEVTLTTVAGAYLAKTRRPGKLIYLYTYSSEQQPVLVHTCIHQIVVFKCMAWLATVINSYLYVYRIAHQSAITSY